MLINLEIPEQENKSGGWTVDYKFLEIVEDMIRDSDDVFIVPSAEEIETVILILAKISKQSSAIKKEISRVFIGKRGDVNIFECVVLLDDGRIGTAWSEIRTVYGGLNYFSGYLDKKPEMDRA